MNQPAMHERMHPMWPDHWDPYAKRDYVVHLMDEGTRNTLWRADYSVELFTSGCLDAPEDIPLGATAQVQTIGGYRREEYLRLGREWESWNGYLQASAGTAAMLKKILAEADA